MGEQEVDKRAGSHRPGVDPGKLKELGFSREKLGNGNIEVRFTDLGRDAARITALFNQASSIQHLSGVAPEILPEGKDVRRYGEKFPEYGVLVATKEDIRAYYNKRKLNLTLLVAEDKSLGVVGTVTIEAPGGLGLLWAGVSRLVVDENQRKRGIGKALLRSANAFIFMSQEAGGLGCYGAQAGIIRGVEGSDIAGRLFESQGYTFRHQANRNCVSWDIRKEEFVQRDTFNVGLWVRDASRGWSKYFPQEAHQAS